MGETTRGKQSRPDDVTSAKRDASSPDSDVTSGVPGPPTPPDGGYGWVILFASFICNVLVDGVCFSFGIFYLAFLEYYGESKAKTSWVGSVLNGMYLSMGPIVSALANKYGCRAVTIAGGILATAGFIASTFSPNVNVLILTYGALGGMGFGLMYLPAIVMVGFYFEKKRALATGVAVCGSGIGAFVFAPLTQRLLSEYGWQGATWIIAAIVLNGVVMGALFRPLEASRQAAPPPKDQQEMELQELGKYCKQTPSPEDDEPRDFMRSKMKYNVAVSVQNGEPPVGQSRTLHSLQDLNTCAQECPTQNYCKSLNNVYVCETHQAAAPTADDLKRPMYRKDIFYSGSLHHLPEYQSNPDVTSYVRSVTSVPEPVPPEKQSVLGRCCGQFKAATDTLRQMMDFSLLKHPVFCVYGLSCFLCMGGFFVPFIYLPDAALNHGVSLEQAAFLLSIIGIANTVARVLCGWVSDQSWADCLVINNLALVIGGVATILCPFCVNYGMLAAYSAIFGSCIAAFVSLRSIIMVELMGLEKLTNAFGLVTMCQGLSAFIGAPIAGALFDWTGNYNLSFYVAGAALLLAGVICFPLRRISVWWDKKHSPAQHSGYTVVGTPAGQKV